MIVYMAIKALADSVDFWRHTDAKWFGILQLLHVFPQAGHFVGRSLNPRWPWEWFPHPGQGRFCLSDDLELLLGG